MCAAPVAVPAAQERKIATLLFADLVGSTALAADQDPEHTRLVLDRFYEAMAAGIRDAGGTVEKFAGDVVMAAFGSGPCPVDGAPLRTSRARRSVATLWLTWRRGLD